MKKVWVNLILILQQFCVTVCLFYDSSGFKSIAPSSKDLIPCVTSVSNLTHKWKQIICPINVLSWIFFFNLLSYLPGTIWAQQEREPFKNYMYIKLQNYVFFPLEGYPPPSPLVPPKRKSFCQQTLSGIVGYLPAVGQFWPLGCQILGQKNSFLASNLFFFNC